MTVALALAAAIVAQAQVAAPLPGKAPAAVQATVEISPRQHELIDSMTHWALVCPPNDPNPEVRALATRLGELRQTAGVGPLTPEGVAALETRFSAWKNDMSARMATASGKTNDAAFRANAEKGVAELAVLSEKSKLTADELKKSTKEISTLSACVGPVMADYYFDRAVSKGTGALAAARAEGANGTDKFFTSSYKYTAYVGTPRVIRPDSVVVPSGAAFINYTPESLSSQSLMGFISNVSGTAKRYAGKVADAITSFSHEYGIDARLQAAFVWSESMFNPFAKSSVGAMGLGQLMPGTAKGLGVSNAYDIDQNIAGSAKLLKALFSQFSSADELRYTEGLFAKAKDDVRGGKSVGQVWAGVFPKIPLGVKNAIAAYNAGSGAITGKAHGDYTKLPREMTDEARKSGKGYWQTVNYVPSVLKHYFEIYLTTGEKGGPSIFEA